MSFELCKNKDITQFILQKIKIEKYFPYQVHSV